MMTLKVKTSSKEKITRTYFDLEKLKDPKTAELFKRKLAGKFAPLLLLDQDSQVPYDEFTNTMEIVAEEKLGKARKIKKPWIMSDVLESCNERQEKEENWY